MNRNPAHESAQPEPGARRVEPANPWDRLDGETAKAWAAFCAYRDLGPKRSIVQAYRRATGNEGAAQAPGRWNGWSSQFGWIERATLYDAHLVGIAQQSIEQTVADEAAKWARRQMEQRESDWQVAQQLREKARQMLAFPLTREVEKDGVTVTEPARWNLGTVVRMVHAASHLGRLACEMATEHVDFSTMSEGELEELLRNVYGSR